MFFLIIFCVWLATVCGCIYAFHRNYEVYRYRNMLIDELFKHDNWQERDEYFHTVTYNEMVHKFWKPVNSFYDEDKLLK